MHKAARERTRIRARDPKKKGGGRGLSISPKLGEPPLTGNGRIPPRREGEIKNGAIEKEGLHLSLIGQTSGLPM